MLGSTSHLGGHGEDQSPSWLICGFSGQTQTCHGTLAGRLVVVLQVHHASSGNFNCMPVECPNWLVVGLVRCISDFACTTRLLLTLICRQNIQTA